MKRQAFVIAIVAFMGALCSACQNASDRACDSASGLFTASVLRTDFRCGSAVGLLLLQPVWPARRRDRTPRPNPPR